MISDLRFALRQLFKSSGFATIAILTLALGIGLNTSMFTLMNELILQPLPYPDKDHLILVNRTTPQDDRAQHSAADVVELQREAADFVQLGAFRLWGYTVVIPGRPPINFNALRASSEFFTILGIQPQLGRTFTAEENLRGHHVVVLSHDTWMTHFGGDTGIIGRTIDLDGAATEIIGVMPEKFSSLFLFGPGEVFAPIAFTDGEKASRGEAEFGLVGRFKSDLTLDQVNARLETLAGRLAETRAREQSKDGLRARTLEQAIHSPQTVMLTMLMLGLAGGVLMIVCGNLANLQLARATARSREFAIRAALGASRIRLLRPLLAESLLLATVGGALGVVVALWSNQWIIYSLENKLPFTIRFELDLDWRVLTFALGISLFTGVLFGIMPAWLASRVRVNDALKSGARGTTGDRSHSLFKNSLVVLQFAFALLLLACAGFFMSGLKFLSARDPGWNTARVTQGILNLPTIRYTSPEQTYGFYSQVQERLRALPGVDNVSVGWTNPMFQFIPQRNFIIEDRTPPEPGREPLAFVNGINPSYLDTLGIKLISGRHFAETDRLGAPPVAMVNQTMARDLFGNENPIGRRLVDPKAPVRQSMEIVGVFSDVGMAANPQPQPTPFQVFVPLAQECWNYVTVSVSSSNPIAMVEPMRKIVAELDPAIPVTALNTAPKLAESGLAGMQIMTQILSAFGILGLFLSALGLYGVIARLVVQRTPEIGLRLALGAQLRDVMWLVLRSGLILTLIGAALGFALSFGAALGLRAMFPNDSGIDFATMFSVTGILLAVAMLATWLPAHRATKVSPIEALRSE